MPQRRASAAVERRIFLAVWHWMRVRVRYLSVHSGNDDWRWLWPRTFAHDGNRWHLRAWCEQREAWADFTLSRVAEADWPLPGGAPPPPDEAAERVEVLKLRPHQKLSDAKKAAVELDFAMHGGVLEVSANKTMAEYLRARLGLPLADGTPPFPLLEPVE
jgi:predicted DNA-binding transcriptional regulator YafY